MLLVSTRHLMACSKPCLRRSIFNKVLGMDQFKAFEAAAMLIMVFGILFFKLLK